MSKPKLKAFTLGEMIVVTVVASIVVAMGVLVLNMLKKQVHIIQNTYHQKTTVQFFEATFIRDFNARNAYYDEQKNTVSLKNSENSISYTFLDDLILREKDTFPIKIMTKKLFLEGLETKDKYIDAIEINLSEEFSNKQLFIQQTKDAAHYLNNSNN
jgi:type II secretory pathway pseudopilin PulG